MIDINYYVKKRQQGTDYGEIKNELRELGYSKEEITQTISAVDDKFVLLLEEKKNKNVANVLNGIIRLVLGIILLLYSFWVTGASIVYGGAYVSLFILAFTLTTGYWLFKTGRSTLKLALKPKEKTKTEEEILY